MHYYIKLVFEIISAGLAFYAPDLLCKVFNIITPQTFSIQVVKPQEKRRSRDVEEVMIFIPFKFISNNFYNTIFL